MRPDLPACHSFPVPLTPEQRRHALAAALATGLLRLAERPPPRPAPAPKNLAESSQDCLEVSAETRLSVPTGLRTAPTRETEGRTCN